jgi:hypothetical protein
LHTFGAGVDRFALRAPGCRWRTEQRAALAAAKTRNTDRGWCATGSSAGLQREEADVIEMVCRCPAELHRRPMTRPAGLHAALVADGWEGAVAKSTTGRYRCGHRSNSWVKQV